MSDFLKSLGYLAGASRFRRVSEKLYQDGDKIYQDFGIDFRSSWFPVFFVLAHQKKPLTIMEISRKIEFNNITVKNILRDLEKKEYITILPNPNDKRSKIVSISKSGKSLLKKIKPIWKLFEKGIKDLLDQGHPDMMNILDRIDKETDKTSLHQRVKERNFEQIKILDYKPSLKKTIPKTVHPHFWEILTGELEENLKYSKCDPHLNYLNEGGFIFHAFYKKELVGLIAIKRWDDHQLEIDKLFINPNYKNIRVGKILIERTITRCTENDISELWVQLTQAMSRSNSLFQSFDFKEGGISRNKTKSQHIQKVLCLKF